MRLLTFSVLRKSKFKLLYNHVQSKFRSDNVQLNVQNKIAEDKLRGDSNLIAVSPSWPDSEQEIKEGALQGMQVYPDFISEEEETAMMAELEPVLKKMRYEFDHWDDAIHGYKETERSKWKPENETILSRVRALAFATLEDGLPLPYVHVLDLAPSGVIKPHIDAVRFCGAVIAGLSMQSSAVMRLVHDKDKRLQLDALLPRRSLYIMKGSARYDFTHAVLGGEDSVWRGERLMKKRRVAVICRSQPPTPPPEPKLQSEPRVPLTPF